MPPILDRVSFAPTDDLLTAFHEQNVVVHSLDGDVKELALSLLDGGWVEPVTLNLLNHKLVGGHGRVMACEWLRNQSPDWFEHRWELWKAHHEETKIDEERFSPVYWNDALVLSVELTDSEHTAMMIRLNDVDCQGKDDPERLKALLSDLPARLRHLAGHKQAEVKPETQEPEIQAGQKFTRPDAIDYSSDDEPEPGNAVNDSGSISSYQDDGAIDPDQPWIEAEDEEEFEEEEEKAPPVLRSLSLSVTWAQWREWNAWKKANGITRDTDAFVKGHDCYLQPEEENGEEA